MKLSKNLNKKMEIFDISPIIDTKINKDSQINTFRDKIFSSKNFNKNEFEKIFYIIFLKFFPKFYLENYKNNILYLKKNNLIFCPDRIWTFGAQYADDLFKLWLAKCHNKSKLIIFQHGGGQGMHPNEFYYKYDMSICDKFISWGWGNNNLNENKILKIGKINQFYKKKLSRKPEILLLQTYSPARYTTTLGPRPTSSQWLKYFDDQLCFYSNIKTTIKSKSIIRIKGAFDSWGQNDIWKNKFPNVNINYGEGKIESLLKKTKIAVSTYNATTFLENFVYNIPTIIFWDSKYWELDAESEKKIKKLEEVEIFFRDPVSAANKINNIWNSVDLWWNDSKIQNVLDDFKNNYARIPTNPTEEMLKIDNI